MTLDRPSRIIFVVAIAVVLFGTLSPRPPSIPLDHLGDKFEHTLAFAGLALLASLGFPKVAGRVILERLSFLGALIEVFQASSFIQRDCDWHDWVADTAGAAGMLLVLKIVRQMGWLKRWQTFWRMP